MRLPLLLSFVLCSAAPLLPQNAGKIVADLAASCSAAATYKFDGERKPGCRHFGRLTMAGAVGYWVARPGLPARPIPELAPVTITTSRTGTMLTILPLT